MKSLSGEFKRALFNDERNYLVFADITLSDNTEISVSNSEIWAGGFSYEEAVSEDDDFTALGSAIIGSATLILNNIDDEYIAYDFTDASVVLYVGMQFGERLEKIKVGVYTVDGADYNGATLKLTLLDNLSKFDVPYSYTNSSYPTKLQYPASLATIVNDACNRFGVILGTPNFPNNSFQVATRPDDESTTFREVLSWAAAIAGCFLKCNPDGELCFKWFDRAALETSMQNLDGGEFDSHTPYYETGDTADGGSFNPWNTGYVYDGGSFTDTGEIHYFLSQYSYDASLDDVVITGLYTDVDTDGEVVRYSVGTMDYAIELLSNPFITTTNAQSVLNALNTQFVGLRFRKLNISIPNDPSIESGDVAVVIDRKQHVHSILITRNNFAVDNAQTIVCGATTPSRNSATRFSEITKSLVKSKELVANEKTARELAIQSLATAIANKAGAYTTIEQAAGGGQIFYLHDKPNLVDSSSVWMMTAEAFAATTAYNGAHPEQTVWTIGMQVNGDVIARYLSADGINAGWIDTGTLSVENPTTHEETFFADWATGVVKIKATEFSLVGAQITSSWSGDGIPTNSNFPAVNWTTDAIKAQHLDDMYYDENNKTGIYKYSEMYEGLLIRFTGTYSYTGTGEAFIIAFKHGTGWYQYINPFENGDVDVSLFIPTHYKNSSNQPGFLMFIETGDGGLDCSLTYRITVVNDVFPDATYYGTSEPFHGYNISTRDINTDYTLYESAASGVRHRTVNVNTTPLNLNMFYGWKNIGLSGDDEYARALAQNASNAVSTLDSSLYGQAVLNRLTNNGVIQGMWMESNRLYISFTSARGGSLTLGGVNNGYGELHVYDAVGTHEIGTWDKNGIKLTSPPYNYNVADAIEILATDDGREGITFKGNISGASGYIGPVLLDIDDGWPMYDEVFGMKSNMSMGSVAIVSKNGLKGIYVDNSDTRVNGQLYVSGSKSRIVEKTEYGDRILYSYETPTPYFGDIGTAKTDENGEALISIDDIFDETVNTNVEYSVFLQKEGQGDIWVEEKEHSYFIVKGTPDLKFSWEVKAVQKGYESLRLDDDQFNRDGAIQEDDLEQQLAEELAEFDRELEVL